MSYDLTLQQTQVRKQAIDVVTEHFQSQQVDIVRQVEILKESGLWKTLFSNESDWVSKVTAFIEIAKVSPSVVAVLTDVYFCKNFVSDDNYFYASAFFEEKADADFSMIETAARKENAQWIVSGEKWFVPNIELADRFVVLSKNETNGSFLFLAIPKEAQGLHIENQEKMGLAGFTFSKVTFQNVVVPEDSVLKVVEGNIKDVVSYDNAKFVISALSAGIAEASLHDALERSRTREQFGKSIGESQAVQFKIAEMTVRINAGKSLLYNAAQKRDRNEPSETDIAMAKVYLSETANIAVNHSLQIHGIYGILANCNTADLYMSQRLTEVYTQTSEQERAKIAQFVIDQNHQ